MSDPEIDRPTEVELEFGQRKGLMDVLSLVETYHGRKAEIAYIRKLIAAGTCLIERV